jgi:small nuclear ribonucleoprotein (snRNP)-like protein
MLNVDGLNIYNKSFVEKLMFCTIPQSTTSSNPETPGKQKLCSWLNKNFKIEMTDGRVLIGVFLCTDRDGNVILGSCSEYLKPEGKKSLKFT